MPTNQEHKPKRLKKVRSSEAPVSSRGCSRAFIICVLEQMLDYVRSLPHSPDGYSDALVMSWLLEANRRCREGQIVQNLGGTEFCADDPATYWTDPHQFLPTWWKNNVERKSKYETLQRDAATYTSNEKSRQRAFYCTYVIILATNIRNHFEKNRVMCGNASLPGPQTDAPAFDLFCRGGSCGSNGASPRSSLQPSYHSHTSSNYAYMDGCGSLGGARGGTDPRRDYLHSGHSHYPHHYPPDGSTETDHWEENSPSVNLCSRSACPSSPSEHFARSPEPEHYGGVAPNHPSERHDASYGGLFRKECSSFAPTIMTGEQKELFDSMMRGDALHSQSPSTRHLPSPTCEYCVHGDCRTQAQAQSVGSLFSTSPDSNYTSSSFSPPSCPPSHVHHAHMNGSHNSPPPHYDRFDSPRAGDGSYPSVKQDETYPKYLDHDHQKHRSQQQYHPQEKQRKSVHFQPEKNPVRHAPYCNHLQRDDDAPSCAVMGDSTCSGSSFSGSGRTGLMGGGGKSEPSSEGYIQSGECFGDLSGEFGLPFDGLHSDESDDDDGNGVTVEDAFSAIVNSVDFGIAADDCDRTAAASAAAASSGPNATVSSKMDEHMVQVEYAKRRAGDEGYGGRRCNSPSCESTASGCSGNYLMDELMEGPIILTTFSSIAQQVPQHFTSSGTAHLPATSSGSSVRDESREDGVVVRKPKVTSTCHCSLYAPKPIRGDCEASEADSLSTAAICSQNRAFTPQQRQQSSPVKIAIPATAYRCNCATANDSAVSYDAPDVHSKHRCSPVKVNHSLPPFGMKAYGSVPDLQAAASCTHTRIDSGDGDISCSDDEVDEDEDGLLCQSLSYEELATSPLLVHSPRAKHVKTRPGELSLSLSRYSSSSPSSSSSSSEDSFPVRAACHRSGSRRGKGDTPREVNVKGRNGSCSGLRQNGGVTKKDPAMAAYARVRSPKTQSGSVHFDEKAREEKAYRDDCRPLKKYCSMTHTECMSPSTIEGFTLLDISPHSSFSSYSSQPSSQPESPSSCYFSSPSPFTSFTKASDTGTNGVCANASGIGWTLSTLFDTIPDDGIMTSGPEYPLGCSVPSDDAKAVLRDMEKRGYLSGRIEQYTAGPTCNEVDDSFTFMSQMLDDVIVAVEEI